MEKLLIFVLGELLILIGIWFIHRSDLIDRKDTQITVQVDNVIDDHDIVNIKYNDKALTLIGAEYFEKLGLKKPKEGDGK